MKKPRCIAWLLALMMVAGLCLPLTMATAAPPLHHKTTSKSPHGIADKPPPGCPTSPLPK